MLGAWQPMLLADGQCIPPPALTGDQFIKSDNDTLMVHLLRMAGPHVWHQQESRRLNQFHFALLTLNNVPSAHVHHVQG